MFNLDVYRDDSLFPRIDRVEPDFHNFVSFKDRKKYNSDCCYHFFIDDKFFECVWNTPNKYLDMFRSAGSIVMPDFSMFYDMPLPLQMYNKYRAHMLAAFYQTLGIRVLPNITCGDFNSRKWTFRGLPKYSAFAFSSVGCSSIPSYLSYFYRIAIDDLKPIFIYHFRDSKLVLPDLGIPVQNIDCRRGSVWVKDVK